MKNWEKVYLTLDWFKRSRILSSYSDLGQKWGANSWRGQSIEQTIVQDAFPNSSLLRQRSGNVNLFSGLSHPERGNVTVSQFSEEWSVYNKRVSSKRE